MFQILAKLVETPIDSKAKALEELNEIGELLLKETLSSASINGFTDQRYIIENNLFNK